MAAQLLSARRLSTYSRQEFCLALKAVRERKGITLAEIANATKIPAYLFAGLEREDLRRWPKGLFRRSFFRDYARMIGLPPAETCAEFVRWFPDDEGAALPNLAGAADEPEQAEDLPLVLDAAWHGPRASVLARLVAALIDAVAVVVAAALGWAAGMDGPWTIAIFALGYFSMATALFGESPAKWAISNRQSILEALMKVGAAIAPAWRRVADVVSQGFLTADGAVTPEPPQRLRVRIKVPQ